MNNGTTADADPPQTQETTSSTGQAEDGGTQDAQASSRKKRHAGDDFRQSRDELNDDEGDMATGTGEFQRADQEVLSKRRIVKARRPGGYSSSPGEGGGAAAEALDAKPNPFASISLAAATTAAAEGKMDKEEGEEKKVKDKTAPSSASSSTSPTKAPVFGRSFPKINASTILSGASSNGFNGRFGGGGAGSDSGSSTPGEVGEGGVASIRPGTGPGLGSAPVGFASYKLNPFAATAGGGVGGSSSSSSSSSGFASSAATRRSPFEMTGGEGTGEGSSKTQFGAKPEGEEDRNGDAEDLEAEPNASFDVPKVQGLKDPSYKPLTGEEDETCILNLRTKLFRLTEIKKEPVTSTTASPSGPSTGNEAKANGTAAATAPPAPVRRDWVEAGVGQAKILVSRQSSAEGKIIARVVMRREPGTSVLLNALLKDPVGVAKHAEKALRLTCLDQGIPSTFLFKFMLNDEMEQMLKEMEKQLALSKQQEEGTTASGTDNA